MDTLPDLPICLSTVDAMTALGQQKVQKAVFNSAATGG